MKNFETVEAMKLATLNAGQTIHTKGFNSPGDGGGATYLTADPQAVDGYGDHLLTNGNVALLQVSGAVDLLKLGASVTDSDIATLLLSVYGTYEKIRVSKKFNVTDLIVGGITEFSGDGEFVVTGSLTIAAAIEADNVQIFNTSAATSFSISEETLNEIKPLWISDGYGKSQTVYGADAGRSLLGQKDVHGTDYNILYGWRAGELTVDAIESAFVGTYAGASCTAATLSSGVGFGALRGKEDPVGSGNFNNTAAVQVTALGAAALQDGTSHTNCVAVGSGAGKEIPTTNAVVVIGTNACRLAGELERCVVIGGGTGYNLNNGGVAADTLYAVMIGDNVGSGITTAYRSTLVGARAGLYARQCDNNTWLGELTGPDSATHEDIDSSICLGKAARTRFDDTITVGVDLTNTVAGRTLIGNTANQTRCDIAGIYVSTNAAAANVYIDSSSRLYRSTSSVKYKTDVQPMLLDWAYKVLDFKPITYKPTENAENPDWTYYGYGAEQVAEIDPRYVQMAREPVGIDEETGEPALADEHTPNGVMYDRIVTAQGMIIKDLLSRIEALENK